MPKYTVRQARLLSGLTMQEASKRIGVSIGAYYSKEHGKSQFTVTQAYDLANACGMDISDIIFFDNNVPKKRNKRKET